MSERDTREPPADTTDEPFLARWSRLKAEARELEARDAITAPQSPHEAAASTPSGAPPAGEPAAPVPLPDLDQLDENSDYSAFLAQGVDAALRKRALRKLFHSPKFNVFDGLDTYRDDFTSFPALGEVVTADMRHQFERAARELAARAEEALASATPAADAPPPAVARDATTAPADPPTERNEDDAENGTA
jgi:hypothetical protein